MIDENSGIFSEDNSDAFAKFGQIIQNFVDRVDCRVFRKLLYAEDKEQFLKVINRLYNFACSKNLLNLTNVDLSVLIEYINSDFGKARLKLLVSSYSLYIDRKFGQYLN
jgi:hypothetical protein